MRRRLSAKLRAGIARIFAAARAVAAAIGLGYSSTYTTGY